MSQGDDIGPSARALKKYFTAPGDLAKAIKKFLGVKEFKETPEAKTLMNEIDGWLVEIEAKRVKLANELAEAEKAAKTSMRGNEATRMWDDLDKQFHF